MARGFQGCRYHSEVSLSMASKQSEVRDDQNDFRTSAFLPASWHELWRPKLIAPLSLSFLLAKRRQPSIDDLISLCGIAKGRSRQVRLYGPLSRFQSHRFLRFAQLNFNAFRPESRSNEKGSASTQSSYDVSDIRSIPDVLLTSAFETGDEVRIAIGRLCLAYTLDDKYRFTNEKNEDPGWLAFYALKWMISCVQAEQTTREVRHQISWLLHWLLRHAAQGLLASPFELVSSTFPQGYTSTLSHDADPGQAPSALYSP